VRLKRRGVKERADVIGVGDDLEKVLRVLAVADQLLLNS
jgi:hypothetical protein